MHLKGDAHAVRLGKIARLTPVGQDHVVPLIVKDREEVLGPGAGHPVRVLGAGMVTGAAREGHQRINTKLLGKQDRVAVVGIKLLCDLGVRVHGVAVCGERGDRHTVVGHRLFEFGKRRLVGQQCLGVAVRLAGIAARTDLQRLNAKRGKLIKRLLKGQARIQIFKYTKLHIKNLRLFRFYLIVPPHRIPCNPLFTKFKNLHFSIEALKKMYEKAPRPFAEGRLLIAREDKIVSDKAEGDTRADGVYAILRGGRAPRQRSMTRF